MGTGISYDDEDKSYASDSLTCSEFNTTEESSNEPNDKISELDGNFRVDTPPPNPIFRKPVPIKKALLHRTISNNSQLGPIASKPTSPILPKEQPEKEEKEEEKK